MSTTVTYKDNTLTTVNNATKTLKTAGKYMEDDITLVDNSITGSIYQDGDGYLVIDDSESSASQGNLSITANGTYNVADYAGATVNVEDGRVLAMIDRDRRYTFTWPSGSFDIGRYAFCYCRYITFPALPSSARIMGEHAFDTCYELDWTSLPSGVFGTSGFIPSYAFRDCSKLALTSLPDGITIINSNAFQGCTNLALSFLPNSITNIYGNAFQGCTNLAISALPSNIVSSIGSYTFYNCPNITVSTIPSGVTSISNYAFAGCTGITSISSDAALTSIAGSSFIGTSDNPTMSLVSARFPNHSSSSSFSNVFGNNVTPAYACQLLELVDIGSVAGINSNAFANCSSLETLILRKTASVSALSNVNAFTNTPLGSGGTGGTVYVPSSLISAYQTATNWSTLYNAGTVTFTAIEGSEYERD